MSALADASFLLRLILDDAPQSTKDAAAFLRSPEPEREPVWVAPTTVAEMVYVITGPRLAFGRERAGEIVENVLRLPVRVMDRDVIVQALAYYREVHNDWGDCMAAAYASRRTGGRIYAYDRDFDRIPGIEREQPPPAEELGV